MLEHTLAIGTATSGSGCGPGGATFLAGAIGVSLEGSQTDGRCARMTPREYEMMVKAYSADLFRFGYWLCRNRWLAQDLVQETFAAAWKNRDSLRDTASAKSWLFTILRNEHARTFERKRVEIADVDLDDVSAAAPGSVAESAEMESALKMLPENYREPLLLQVLGGFSAREIGDMLGISEDNTMARLSRARKALRAVITGDPTGHGSGGE